MLTDRQILGLHGERGPRRDGWCNVDGPFSISGFGVVIVTSTSWPHGVTGMTRGGSWRSWRCGRALRGFFGTPAESVQYRKQLELMRSARDWMTSNKRSNDTYRFDIVGVVLNGQNVRIQYIPDAFRRGWFRFDIRCSSSYFIRVPSVGHDSRSCLEGMGVPSRRSRLFYV